MKNFSNAINRYDEMIYGSRPVKYNEYISNKYNRVHIELFNDALKKYYDDIINNLINKKFMFEFFKLLEYSYDDNPEIYYQNFIEKYNKKSNYISNVINELTIDKEIFIKKLINISDTYITDLKNSIINNDVLVDDLLNVIKNLSEIGDFRIIYYDKQIYLEGEENDDTIWNKEYSSYVISNTNNDEYELITENYFLTDEDDYVFILENELGTKIAYNTMGEFVLILDSVKYNENPINNFNFPIYIKKKNKGILNDFRNYGITLYKENHKIIEIKEDEYWKPSSIIIMSNIKPYKKIIKSLDKYWNNFQSMNHLNIDDLKITNSKINDAELIELNYIRGVAKMYSKIEDIEFEVPFEYLNQDVNVNEDLILNLIK